MQKNPIIEVPYNFDKKLIDYLYQYDKSGDKYHCIYCPPYWKDYKCAKFYNGKTITSGVNKIRLLTREEYEEHILKINTFFPHKLMLLLQQTDEQINTNLLKNYYIDKLGFEIFCVGSIEQAKIIKSINPDLEVVASITMKCEPEDLKNEEFKKCFDCVVLWFPYNRDIEKVKSLPKEYKYILLCNCFCSIHCQGSHHWLAKTFFDDQNCKCPPREKFEDKIHIKAEHLYLWKDYISYFKLQGREYATNRILDDIVLYLSVDLEKSKTNEEVYNERLLYTKK